MLIRATLLILTLLLFSGCSSTLKQQWYDFTAYYNTFYNAQEYFESGLEQDRRAREPLNPNELVRIHPPPSGSGDADFAVAIEKSAEILRRHSRSSYVDDAVALIGKSYFYRREYFSAQEQFRSLQQTTSDSEVRQMAIIWEGRIYLELGLNAEGIRFLEEQVGIPDSWSFLDPADGLPTLQEWSPERLAEVRVVLAQLYAFRGDLQMAGLQLLHALGDLDRGTLAPRAYFHYGQLMERQENFEQAVTAYEMVTRLRSDFDLEYQAAIRLANVMQRQGNEQQAMDVLIQMEREDRYRDHRGELNLEIARAERAIGQPEQAEQRFNMILHGDRLTPEPFVRARTYLELGELYRLEREDFLAAAAYYDSAASIRVSPDRLPVDWNVDELAEIWGEYAAIREEIEQSNLLLELSELDEEALEQRLQAMRSELEEETRESATQTWQVEPEPDAESAEGVTTDLSGQGFLNVRNSEWRTRTMNQFQLLWNQPPLVDHWRRSQAHTGLRDIASPIGVTTGLFSGGEPLGDDAISGDGEAARLPFELADIPQSPQERAALEARLANGYYRLGHLYLLRLELPEEAQHAFTSVWESEYGGDIRISAGYALAELALMRGDQAEALEWAARLFELDPEARQSARIAERLGIEQSDRRTLQPVSEDRDLTASLLLEQAREAILEIRDEESYRTRQKLWYRLQESSRNSDLLAPLMAVIYPYQGEEWDRIRTILRTIVDEYPGSRASDQASGLLDELDRYAHLLTQLEEPSLISVP